MRFKEIQTLFVHVPKTGGSTITRSIGKQLYGEQTNLMRLYADASKRVVLRRGRKAHVKAHAYLEKMKDSYSNYYKFAFIRNPFSQIRSLFGQFQLMNIKQNERFIPYKKTTFEDYILGKGDVSIREDNNWIDQVSYLTSEDGSEVIVDDVFPFEYYNESVSVISDKLGFEISTKDFIRYTGSTETYTPEMIECVLDQYRHVYDFHQKVKKDFEINVLSKT